MGIFPRTILRLNKSFVVKYLFFHDVECSELIGKFVSIKLLGLGNCMNCGIKLKDVIRKDQNYCWKCFMSLPYTDKCMIRPELCHYHLGTCRDPSWGRRRCFTTHFLYLAYSNDYKIGVTSERNIPKRFVQQGASYVLPVLKTTSRRVAGYLEAYLKDYFRHTTYYLKMLSTNPSLPPEDMFLKRIEVVDHLSDKIIDYKENVTVFDVSQRSHLLSIKYPFYQPVVRKSLNLLKSKSIEGKLLGLKGQYMVLDTGVFKFSSMDGKFCSMSWSTDRET